MLFNEDTQTLTNPKIEGILMKMPRSCAAAVEAYCKALELRIFAKFTDF